MLVGDAVGHMNVVVEPFVTIPFRFSVSSLLQFLFFLLGTVGTVFEAVV